MKKILSLTSAALLATVTFAAAQTPQQTQQPAESGQKAERNPSGRVGGSEDNPSPATTGSSARPRTNAPAESGQAAERNPDGSTGGSEKRPSPR